MTPDVKEALDQYVTAVRTHYGSSVEGIYLFGSRARGDHHADSDADIAVVLKDGTWGFWAEKMNLAGLAYDVLLDHGLFIQPWPIPLSAWETPARSQKRNFIEAIRRDARDLLETA